MNCSMPIDPLYAEKYKFRLVPVSEVVVFEGEQDRINYKPEQAEAQAAQLLEMAIGNFKDRRATVEPVPELPVRDAVVGFSTESILELLGGSLDPLLDALKSGTIRGVAGLVSCTSLRDAGQDIHSVEVARQLIKRDVLILSMGCGNPAVQVAGLCSLEAAASAGPGLKKLCETLGTPPVLSYGTCTDTGRLGDLLAAISVALGGVAIPDLPVAAVAPEYMEQKATIDAVYALAMGLYTYVNPVPPIAGAPNLVRLLTQDCRDVTGGSLHVETDAVEAVDGILYRGAIKMRQIRAIKMRKLIRQGVLGMRLHVESWRSRQVAEQTKRKGTPQAGSLFPSRFSLEARLRHCPVQPSICRLRMAQQACISQKSHFGRTQKSRFARNTTRGRYSGAY
jgi:carbon-monoxide dehydrogenase catalytic subunit